MSSGVSKVQVPGADEPDNFALQSLRRIGGELDRVIEDAPDLKFRMMTPGERFSGVEMSLAGVQRRVDPVEGRLERIERRLDLVEAPEGFR